MFLVHNYNFIYKEEGSWKTNLNIYNIGGCGEWKSWISTSWGMRTTTKQMTSIPLNKIQASNILGRGKINNLSKKKHIYLYKYCAKTSRWITTDRDSQVIDSLLREGTFSININWIWWRSNRYDWQYINMYGCWNCLPSYF